MHFKKINPYLATKESLYQLQFHNRCQTKLSHVAWIDLQTAFCSHTKRFNCVRVNTTQTTSNRFSLNRFRTCKRDSSVISLSSLTCSLQERQGNEYCNKENHSILKKVNFPLNCYKSHVRMNITFNVCGCVPQTPCYCAIQSSYAFEQHIQNNGGTLDAYPH